MNLLDRMRIAAGRERRSARFRAIYRRFSEFTMIPADIYMDNLMLAQRVAGLPGCVVECGVWRGGMSAGLASVLGADREYYLFDSFEGLPPAKAVDGDAAIQWQNQKTSPDYYDNCAAPIDAARQSMTLSGAKSFHLMKGWFNETLPGFAPSETIALLRLDGDWYDSTMVCLDSLFDKVIPGGLIVLDDYFTWDGCARALHDFLSRRSAVERIQTQGDVCYLEKKAPAPAKNNNGHR